MGEKRGKSAGEGATRKRLRYLLVILVVYPLAGIALTFLFLKTEPVKIKYISYLPSVIGMVLAVLNGISKLEKLKRIDWKIFKVINTAFLGAYLVCLGVALYPVINPRYDKEKWEARLKYEYPGIYLLSDQNFLDATKTRTETRLLIIPFNIPGREKGKKAIEWFGHPEFKDNLEKKYLELQATDENKSHDRDEKPSHTNKLCARVYYKLYPDSTIAELIGSTKADYIMTTNMTVDAEPAGKPVVYQAEVYLFTRGDEIPTKLLHKNIPLPTGEDAGYFAAFRDTLTVKTLESLTGICEKTIWEKLGLGEFETNSSLNPLRDNFFAASAYAADTLRKNENAVIPDVYLDALYFILMDYTYKRGEFAKTRSYAEKLLSRKNYRGEATKTAIEEYKQLSEEHILVPNEKQPPPPPGTGVITTKKTPVIVACQVPKFKPGPKIIIIDELFNSVKNKSIPEPTVYEELTQRSENFLAPYFYVEDPEKIFGKPKDSFSTPEEKGLYVIFYYYQIGQFENVIEKSEEIIEVLPPFTQAWAYNLNGICSYKLGRYQIAEKNINKATSLTGNKYYSMNQILIYTAPGLGKEDLIIPTILADFPVQPAESWYNKSFVYYSFGRDVSALTELANLPPHTSGDRKNDLYARDFLFKAIIHKRLHERDKIVRALEQAKAWASSESAVNEWVIKSGYFDSYKEDEFFKPIFGNN